MNKKICLLIKLFVLFFIISCTSGTTVVKTTGEINMRSLEADPEFSSVLISINRELRLAYEYYLKGDFKKALRVYKKAARSYMKYDYRHRLATIYSNIGTIFLKINQLKTAKQYLRESTRLSHQFIRSKEVRIRIRAVNLYKIAKIYLFQNKLKQCKKLNSHSYKLNRQITNYPGYAKNYRVDGMYYVAMKKYKKAVVSFTNAVKYNLTFSDFYDLILNRISLGDIYLLKKKYKSALSQYKRALYIAKKREYSEKINQVLYKFAVLWDKRKRYKRALGYYKRAYETALNLETNDDIRRIREKLSFDRIKQIYIMLKKTKDLKIYQEKINFFYYTRFKE